MGIPLVIGALSDGSAHRDVPPVTSRPTTLNTAPPVAGPAVAARAALVSWARRSLSTQSVIVSDQATLANLHRAGFAAAVRFGDPTAATLVRVDYVIDVAGSGVTGDVAARSRTNVLAHSLPLAIVGPARTPSSARQVFPKHLDAARAQQKSDAALRTKAGRELLANPAVVPDAGVRAALRHGTLDLRVDNVLADLAATTGVVYVSKPVRDPAETRAGLPIRSVVVTTEDARATQSILRSMGAPYRPETIESISPRRLRIAWRPAIAVDTTVGG